jgi:hypothetical protein
VELYEQIRREYEFGAGTIMRIARKLGVHCPGGDGKRTGAEPLLDLPRARVTVSTPVKGLSGAHCCVRILNHSRAPFTKTLRSVARKARSESIRCIISWCSPQRLRRRGHVRHVKSLRRRSAYVAKTSSSFRRSSGLERYPSIPAARQRSRSPVIANAVMAMTGW